MECGISKAIVILRIVMSANTMCSVILCNISEVFAHALPEGAFGVSVVLCFAYQLQIMQ